MSFKTGFYEGRLGIGLGSTMGMGDGNPRYPLDINGDIRLTGSIVNGNGQVLSLVPSESAWTIGDSNLSYTGGNVGIGTTSPGSTLEIKDVTSGTAGEVESILKVNSVSGYHMVSLGTAGPTTYHSGSISIYKTTNATGTIKSVHLSGSTDDTYFNGGGNVGIGTTSPGSLLQVGTDDSSIVSDGTIRIAKSSGTSSRRWGHLGYDSGYNFGWGDQSSTDKQFKIAYGAPANSLVVKYDGNVGIGTTNPSTLLVVGEDGGGHATNVPGIHMKSTTSNTKHYVVGQDTTHNVFLTYHANSTVANGYGIVSCYGGNNNLCLQHGGGNVGIGTTSPSNAELHIANSGRIRFGTKSHLGNHTSGNSTGHVYNDTYGLYWSNCHADNAQSIGAKIVGINRLGTSAQYNITHVDLAFSLVNEYGGSTGVYDATTELMRLKATNDGGRVGIGTTSPGEKLEVNGNIKLGNSNGTLITDNQIYRPGNNDFHIQYGGSGDITMCYGGGNVGIGTTDPGIHRLHVKGTTSAPMYGQALKVSTNGACWLELEANAGGSSEEWGICSAADGDLDFYKRTGTGGVGYKMTITGSGNVGIGTTSPANKLEIHGGPLGLKNGNHTATTAQQILFGFSGVANLEYAHSIRTRHVNNIGDDTQNSIDFYLWKKGDTTTTIGEKHGMSITAAGVGIGTTSPDNLLHLKGGYPLKCESATNSSHYLILDYNQVQSNGDKLHINHNTTNDVGIACGGGNVGIGTHSPSRKLHVHGDVVIGAHDSQPTDTTVLTDPNGKQNAIMFYNRYYTWGGGSAIYGAPGVRTWHNFISSKYHSTDPYSGSAGYHAFLLWTYCGHHGTADVAMRMGSGNGNSKIWVNGSTTISSDRRIKTNITDVPDDLALEMVRKIPCRYYEYKRDIYNEYDYQREKPNRTIGFIAQEVKEICPEAVDITEYKIPLDNKIYRDLDIQIDNSKNFIIIKDYSNNDLSANDEVECVINPMNNNNITQDNYKEYIDISDNQTINIKYISGCNFEILDNIDNLVFEEILLKNKKVDDFHTLDKQKLFALNFSATQELDRQQQADKAKIAELENKVATLESELAAIKQHLGI